MWLLIFLISLTVLNFKPVLLIKLILFYMSEPIAPIGHQTMSFSSSLFLKYSIRVRIPNAAPPIKIVSARRGVMHVGESLAGESLFCRQNRWELHSQGSLARGVISGTQGSLWHVGAPPARRGVSNTQGSPWLVGESPSAVPCSGLVGLYCNNLEVMK